MVLFHNIDAAAEALRSGGLVAFPTETVYGLGADAANAAAVGRIFAAKGRPVDHPLIVHLARSEELSRWAEEVPEIAWRLAKRFWPGPLTLVLRRGKRVSLAVTGGLDTVAVRVPAHPTALALLERFGGGVAAPSANRFGRLSPTTATHVAEELGDRIDGILDGGPCEVGIESTIVDVSGDRPAILRPGGVTQAALAEAIGCAVPMQEGGPVRCPGQLPSHYAPRAQVVVARADEAPSVVHRLNSRGCRVAILCSRPSVHQHLNAATVAIAEEPVLMARQLYARLREADALGVDAILVLAPTRDGLGLAIGDRLRRAAGPRANGLTEGAGVTHAARPG